jgi:hypothetical protein
MKGIQGQLPRFYIIKTLEGPEITKELRRIGLLNNITRKAFEGARVQFIYALEHIICNCGAQILPESRFYEIQYAGQSTIHENFKCALNYLLMRKNLQEKKRAGIVFAPGTPHWT